jgi:hypothetical protein
MYYDTRSNVVLLETSPIVTYLKMILDMSLYAVAASFMRSLNLENS